MCTHQSKPDVKLFKAGKCTAIQIQDRNNSLFARISGRKTGQAWIENNVMSFTNALCFLKKKVLSNEERVIQGVEQSWYLNLINSSTNKNQQC